MSDVPDTANDGCVGTGSDQAGKADGCAGCPNQKACASGAARAPDPALGAVAQRMADIKHKILVLSGKGGVGKSSFSTQLAFALAAQGKQVGLLDVDLCGPSIPRMLGLQGQEVHQSASGWSPVYVEDNLGVMSIGFMLPNADDAVIWRGPRKNGLIKQFLTDVDWGALDYLIVDTPPGTSDEHISMVQYLQAGPGDGAVVITTAPEVAMADVRKELSFCKKTSLPVLGIVENMAGFSAPLPSLRFKDSASGADTTEAALAALQAKCPELLGMSIFADVFPAPEGGGPRGMADKFGCPFLGSIPLDPDVLRACEAGKSYLELFPAGAAAPALKAVVAAVVAALPDDEEEDATMS
jgi:Mrp family chromosome partitioning ATPase